METAGLRELRQSASDLVRRAEAGETITVTVSGREAALLGPVDGRRWRRWADLAQVYAGPDDPAWPSDREHLDDELRDPFSA